MSDSNGGWRATLHEVIFEADTAEGKAFDVALLAAIVVSVLAVLLESVASIEAAYGPVLRIAEWTFTLMFTIEYVLRLLAVQRPWSYATSFYGIVDLLAIVPTYASVVFAGSQSLIVIRALRLLRVYRVLKLAHYVEEGALLYRAIIGSARKIVIFVGAVGTVVIVIGTAMYLIEGGANGFTSIPQTLYWAVVTMTTVGYGDLVPQTTLGKALASMIMVVGYGIIAVPTGIVTAEMMGSFKAAHVSTQACPHCATEGHDPDARFCKACGARL